MYLIKKDLRIFEILNFLASRSAQRWLKPIFNGLQLKSKICIKGSVRGSIFLDSHLPFPSFQPPAFQEDTEADCEEIICFHDRQQASYPTLTIRLPSKWKSTSNLSYPVRGWQFWGEMFWKNPLISPFPSNKHVFCTKYAFYY